MYILLSILMLAVLTPIIIGFLVVKLTEKERPKGFGKAIYNKSPAGLIEQQAHAEQLTNSASNSIPDKDRIENPMVNTIACYEKNKKRLQYEFWVYCALPFLGFIHDTTIGLFGLIFLSPFWILMLWASRKQLKRADHKIILTRKYIKVDGFSTEIIPWGDIQEFRLVTRSLGRGVRAHVLIADFVDNSKYQQSMGKLNSKAHNLLYKTGVVLDNLNYYKESPEKIVRELNLRLKRSASHKRA
jgi:hypothetical protein